MGKRKIAYTLLLGGVTFVALLHTALAFVFDTGLADVGVLVAGLGVFGLLFVNLGIPERAEEGGTDSSEADSDSD